MDALGRQLGQLQGHSVGGFQESWFLELRRAQFSLTRVMMVVVVMAEGAGSGRKEADRGP